MKKVEGIRGELLSLSFSIVDEIFLLMRAI